MTSTKLCRPLSRLLDRYFREEWASAVFHDRFPDFLREKQDILSTPTAVSRSVASRANSSFNFSRLPPSVSLTLSLSLPPSLSLSCVHRMVIRYQWLEKVQQMVEDGHSVSAHCPLQCQLCYYLVHILQLSVESYQPQLMTEFARSPLRTVLIRRLHRYLHYNSYHLPMFSPHSLATDMTQ